MMRKVGVAVSRVGLILMLGMFGVPLVAPSFSQSNSASSSPALKEALELNQQAVQLYKQGKYREAIAIAQRSLAIYEKVLGAEHPNVATSLNNLAALYKSQGNYQAAEPLYKRSLAIREKTLEAEHLDVSQSLNNLAESYREQGNYQAAEPLYKRSLAIFEKALGAEHPNVATSLNNLALLYREQGNYQAAEPLYKRSLTIYEKVFGAEHSNVATSLNNLATLYWSQGSYPAAEPLLKRSLAIFEKALGAEHPKVSTSLHNLAFLYREQGNYPAAEPLLKRSLMISEKALGANHPLVATSLNNLALLYRAQGNYPAAEPLLKRSLAIFEKAFGGEHPDVASSLNNLAELYRSQGNSPAAEALFKRSLAILEKAFGGEHPDVASSLNNLAELYRRQGNYSATEPLYKRSLSILEKALGTEHRLVASSLNNLALSNYSQGNYPAAETLFKRSLAIYQKALGSEHPDVAKNLNNLAFLHQAQGNIDRAITFRQQELEVQEHNLKLNLVSGTERQKEAYVKTVLHGTFGTVSLHVQAAPTNPAAIRLALTAILQRKGRLLDILSTNLQTLRQYLTPDLQPQFDQWLALKSQLANLALKNTPIDKYRPLQQQAEELESNLNRRSSEFQAITETVTIEAVQKQIPTDAVLIELFRYSPFNPKASQKDQWGNPRYVAYILHSQGEPKWVDLGEAATLEPSIQTFRKAIGRNPTKPDRDSDPQLTIAEVKQAARNLDQKLMQPIRPLLGNARHLLISPDSQLNLIPFAALVDEQNRFLLETHDITYLSSGRDLLRLKRTGINLQNPVLFSDPNYGKPSDKLIASIGRNPCETKIATRGEEITELANQIFCQLPNVAAETNAIQNLLPRSQLLSQSQATKATAKQLRNPSILHFATHGFFLPDPPNTNPDTPIRQNPLSRSALVERQPSFNRQDIRFVSPIYSR